MTAKHLTRDELEASAADARTELLERHDQDGPRNAALFAPVVATLERFRDTPHAELGAGTLVALSAELERVGQCYRVADSYRAVFAATLSRLTGREHEPAAVEAAHLGAAQYAAASRQLADALADVEAAAFHHLEAVLEDAHEGARR